MKKVLEIPVCSMIVGWDAPILSSRKNVKVWSIDMKAAWRNYTLREFLTRALVTRCIFISQYVEYGKTWKSITLITRIANKELRSTDCIEFRVDLVAWKMSLEVKETMTCSRHLGKLPDTRGTLDEG